jgi:6-phosphogluconolactonase
MVMSADGKYIYDVLNGKGLDGVSVFEINQEDGTLQLIQYLPVDGVWARGIGIAPDGKHLIIVCMDDDGGVMSFKIGDDGRLTPTGVRLSIPGAAYVTFYTVD